MKFKLYRKEGFEIAVACRANDFVAPTNVKRVMVWWINSETNVTEHYSFSSFLDHLSKCDPHGEYEVVNRLNVSGGIFPRLEDKAILESMVDKQAILESMVDKQALLDEIADDQAALDEERESDDDE